MAMMLLALALFGTAAAALPPNYPTTPMKGVHGNVPMPMIGIGTWQYNSSTAEAAVTAAFKIGYRHVDTADSYANQVGVGRALKASAVPREEYFVTTKIAGGLNASATVEAADGCLKELGLDYVDLMMIHFPATWTGKGGPAARKEEWLALERWAKSGKARALGVSHYCKQHIEDIRSVATVPVAINQVEYHIGMGSEAAALTDDKEWMQSHGVLYQSFSSLCGPCGDHELITGELVTEIGKAHGKSGAQVSLRWVVQQGIPVIPKSSNPKHIAENMDLFNWTLSREEMARLTADNSTGIASHSQDCTVAETAVLV